MSGSSSLKALWHMQSGECFYCGRQTWLQASGRESQAQAKARLGCVTRSQLINRRASKEHLVRRADGGKNDMQNYVMACQECNSARHEKPVLIHFAEMRSRVTA